MKPIVAISLGDPAGIGPELCCRAAADPAVQERCRPVVIGQRDLLARVAAATGQPVPERIVEVLPDWPATKLEPGRSDAACGRLAAACVEEAIAGCRDGRYAALVTAPIDKASLAAAACDFPGHTELLAHRCGLTADAVTMVLHGDALNVALATCHRSLASVPGALSQEAILRTARHLHGLLSALLDREPILACCGLNPHAGERGRFGDEEERICRPALATLAAEMDIVGPLPPDTAFTPSNRERFDGHVCCYHDQGLIPFKALCFHDGVNLTCGLPIVRCSPDHGTAYDLAWTGRADPGSMLAAIHLAVDLA